jgi:hypothetical protein
MIRRRSSEWGFVSTRLAVLKSLQHGGAKFGGRERVLENRHGAQFKGLPSSLGMNPREHQDDRNIDVLSPHIGQQFQPIYVAWIDTGENQVHCVAFHEADSDSVGGSFLDEVTQGTQHRSQESKAPRFGADNQDPELPHGVHSFVSIVVVRNQEAGA